MDRLATTRNLRHCLNTGFPNTGHFSLRNNSTLVPVLGRVVHRTNGDNAQRIILKVTRHNHLGILIGILNGGPRSLFSRFTNGRGRRLNANSIGCRVNFSSSFRASNNLIRLTLTFGPSRLRVMDPIIVNSIHTHLSELSRPDDGGILPVAVRNSTTIAKRNIIRRALGVSGTHNCRINNAMHVIVGGRINFAASGPLSTHSAPCYASVNGVIRTPVFRIGTSSPRTITFIAHLTLSFHGAFGHSIFVSLIYCHHRNRGRTSRPDTARPLVCRGVGGRPAPHGVCTSGLRRRGITALRSTARVIGLCHSTLSTNSYIMTR